MEKFERELIDQLLNRCRLPEVMVAREIDHDNVAEYIGISADEANRQRITKLLEEGWVLYRVQTEPDGICGVTMAYMAKMKTNRMPTPAPTVATP